MKWQIAWQGDLNGEVVISVSSSFANDVRKMNEEKGKESDDTNGERG